jgi:hypothetical protein
VATLETFLVQFPEFGDTNPAQVQAFLDAAELEIDRDVWLAKGDQGQMYLAAHKLALSPYGNASEMVLKKPNPGPHGETSFGTHYDSLVMQVSSGYRVT